MKEERVGEEQRNGKALVKKKKQTWMMRSPIHARRLNREPMHRCSPPPILSTLFCSISFITVSWLRNRAIVQLLDHEGQQKIHCGFDTVLQGG